MRSETCRGIAVTCCVIKSAALPLRTGGWAVAANRRRHSRLWLEPAGVWHGIEGEHVGCYDRDGRRHKKYTEVTQVLASETRADAEERAAAATRTCAAAETR